MQPNPNRPLFFQQCPVCHQPTSKTDSHCSYCHVDLEVARAQVLKDMMIKTAEEGAKVGYYSAQLKQEEEEKRKRQQAPPPPVPKYVPQKKKVRDFTGLIVVLLALGIVLITSIPGIKATSSTPTGTLRPTSISKTKTPAPPLSATHNDPTTKPNSNCIHWSKVTFQMAGQLACVYGEISQVYQTNESWTRIKFSNRPNTFFMHSTSFYYTDPVTGKEIGAGDCIQNTGTIELYSGVPSMKITNPKKCD